MNTTDRPADEAPKMEAPGADAAPETPQITIDDFLKVDLRIGRVVTAEPVPKSRKLIRLEIDDGRGVRQVLGGLAKSHEPAALVGRHVVFIANLRPAKLAGLESNGMVLAALDAAGEAVLLTVEDPARAPAGSAVR